MNLFCIMQSHVDKTNKKLLLCGNIDNRPNIFGERTHLSKNVSVPKSKCMSTITPPLLPLKQSPTTNVYHVQFLVKKQQLKDERGVPFQLLTTFFFLFVLSFSFLPNKYIYFTLFEAAL